MCDVSRNRRDRSAVWSLLDGWGETQTSEVIARSIIDPSADISHGFDGAELVTKDGKTINGLLIQEGNPLIIVSMGGITQILPKTKIAGKSQDDPIHDAERRPTRADGAGCR